MKGGADRCKGGEGCKFVRRVKDGEGCILGGEEV